jgi:hypothetical protein
MKRLRKHGMQEDRRLRLSCVPFGEQYGEFALVCVVVVVLQRASAVFAVILLAHLRWQLSLFELALIERLNNRSCDRSAHGQDGDRERLRLACFDPSYRAIEAAGR